MRRSRERKYSGHNVYINKTKPQVRFVPDSDEPNPSSAEVSFVEDSPRWWLGSLSPYAQERYAVYLAKKAQDGETRPSA